jgi:hypothetical protein
MKSVAKKPIESIEPLQKESTEALSANDLILKRYLETKDKLKALELELKKLSEDLIHQGTFSTKNYVCIVSEVKGSLRLPPKDVLVQEFGPRVIELCVLSKGYKTVKVSKKGEV